MKIVAIINGKQVAEFSSVADCKAWMASQSDDKVTLLVEGSE